MGRARVAERPQSVALHTAEENRMTRIACKFGGSSVADASQFKKVRAIIEENPARSIIVVSAPVKRVKTEAKITDLLYLCHDMALMGVFNDTATTLIYTRYVE